MTRKFEHICEVCGITKVMTPQEAFEEGWDYPPLMGSFGVISPRTCGNCLITETAWWALVHDKKQMKDLSNKQKETIQRILNESNYITSSMINV